MDFQEFLEIVPEIINSRLPAFDAHIKMAPLERIESLKKTDASNEIHRLASVLMLLYPKNGKVHLVLIVRNSYDGVHSAQVAFPGGKHEKDDLDFSYTALRETYEEIGIDPSKIKIIKPFTELYIPPSNFLVYPFLGISKEPLDFILDPLEVAQIIEIPLMLLLNNEILVNKKQITSYSNEIFVPGFNINEHIVWGATAMILSELKEVLIQVLQPNRES
ncbi:putative Nudix hydrolase NudL [Flavobacterium sp. CECT 9288]|jgi:8-oxo-dGTP pyrophosphatase MutT (NUDIX family)|uniref:NUDIX hydrolase n=1 Tax=unclassified Flavobacterium TaxID=196869 RepID=UPI000A3A13B5|nr:MULTISPECIES: CoA pyrophosphatase [unclassified Flavobacterium]OUD35637.1 coenzyme A pyrophosphatase [Flavobacterium sp. FPG59]CAH0335963.1 putative Nudix hydrolase NudL [Flavobacterium sp. CECT 9288]